MTLKEAIQETETLMACYQPLLAKAKAFDGKVMNKRIIDAFTYDDIYTQYYKSGNAYNLTIYKQFYHYKPLIQIYNVEYAELVKNKRFNYNCFEAIVKTKVNDMKQEVAKMKQDLIDGNTRLQRFNELVKQIEDMKWEFSIQFRELNSFYFDRVH